MWQTTGNLALALLTLWGSGCASPGRVNRASSAMTDPSVAASVPSDARDLASDSRASTPPEPGAKAGGSEIVPVAADIETPPDEFLPPSLPGGVLELTQVIDSVYRSFPLLVAALYARDVTSGEHLAAHGAFDLKLKGATENGPLGFYQTYRQHVGVEQPMYWGGSLFGGYRIGRGGCQPWYLDRQTND